MAKPLIFRAQSLWQALFASRRKAYEAPGMKHRIGCDLK